MVTAGLTITTTGILKCENTNPTLGSAPALSPVFLKLPHELLRIVLEATLTNEENETARQRISFTYCLISREVQTWIEPLLYEKVVLESSKQVVCFLRTLDLKFTSFLSRIVKTVWVLDDSFPLNETYRFERLFTRCKSLENIACLGSSVRILRTIPKTDTSYNLRELTLIRPSSAHYLYLHHLSLQRLHIVDYCGTFLGSLNATARRDSQLLSSLRGIRQILLDSISVPDNYLTWELKHGFIPLLLLQTPNSENTVCIRTTWRRRSEKRLPDKYLGKDVNKWVEELDASAEQSRHRLFVAAESPSEMEEALQLNDLQLALARVGS